MSRSKKKYPTSNLYCFSEYDLRGAKKSANRVFRRISRARIKKNWYEDDFVCLLRKRVPEHVRGSNTSYVRWYSPFSSSSYNTRDYKYLGSKKGITPYIAWYLERLVK